MLDDEAEAPTRSREALTEAIIREHRASRAAAWASSCSARSPMLDTPAGPPRQRRSGRRARPASSRRSGGAHGGAASLDRLPMQLRQRTERQVFIPSQGAREQPTRHRRVEALETRNGRPRSPSRARTDEELSTRGPHQRAVQEECQRAGSTWSGDGAVETTARVRRSEPDETTWPAKASHQRLKRQRSRAMQRQKSLLTSASRSSSPSASEGIWRRTSTRRSAVPRRAKARNSRTRRGQAPAGRGVVVPR